MSLTGWRHEPQPVWSPMMIDRDFLKSMLEEILEPVLGASVLGADLDSNTSFSATSNQELQAAYRSACEILAKEPRNVPALLERALVCRAKGRYGQALADFHEVIRLDPKNGPAWLYISEVLANLGEHDKAREERKVALQINPQLK
jgi:tetratricopeptide (TPR) repeat protein